MACIKSSQQLISETPIKYQRKEQKLSNFTKGIQLLFIFTSKQKEYFRNDTGEEKQKQANKQTKTKKVAQRVNFQ